MHEILPMPSSPLDAFRSRSLAAVEFVDVEAPPPTAVEAPAHSSHAGFLGRVAQAAALSVLAVAALGLVLLMSVPAGFLAVMLLLPAVAPIVLWCLTILGDADRGNLVGNP